MFKLCVNAARINILETVDKRIQGAQKGGNTPKKQEDVWFVIEYAIKNCKRKTTHSL